MEGWKKFILRGNVIDLAVGVVIGAAFNSVVQSFVEDILTPLLGAIGGQPDFSSFTFTIGRATFSYGNFLNSLLSFLIISTVIYFLVVLPVNRLTEKSANNKGDEAKIDNKICPFCLSKIPVKAKRCRYCTSTLVKA